MISKTPLLSLSDKSSEVCGSWRIAFCHGCVRVTDHHRPFQLSLKRREGQLLTSTIPVCLCPAFSSLSFTGALQSSCYLSPFFLLTWWEGCSRWVVWGSFLSLLLGNEFLRWISCLSLTFPCWGQESQQASLTVMDNKRETWWWTSFQSGIVFHLGGRPHFALMLCF